MDATHEKLDPDSPTFQVFMDWLKANRVSQYGYKDFGATFGPKYIRIVSKDGFGHERHPYDYSYGSAFCFIDRATGDVLKTASWKSPAKGVRGNIYGGPEKFGLTDYGAVYFR
jgi:hypothetical protein